MLYLNHAGTSWPKPPEVQAAVQRAFELDPVAASEVAEADAAEIRRRLVGTRGRLQLTPGCTSALALLIGDLPWRAGDRCLVASLSHVALERPAASLRARGVEVVELPPRFEPDFAPVDLDRLEEGLEGGARAVLVPSADNVSGALFPLAEIASRARAAGALLLVDAAQTAGWLPLPTEHADGLAFGGHKGLQGPWGVGGLWVREGLALQGARLGASASSGWCDAGSLDRSAVAGLRAGLDALERLGPAPARLKRARARLEVLTEHLPLAWRILGPRAPEDRLPTLAVVGPDGRASKGRLEASGVVASFGLQCAPLAHAAFGTPDGCVRFSVGPSGGESLLPVAARLA